MQKVEYQVEVSRVGNGAIEAADQLKRLDAQMVVASKDARTLTGNLAATQQQITRISTQSVSGVTEAKNLASGYKQMGEGAHVAHLAMRELQTTMIVFGGQKMQAAAIATDSVVTGLKLIKYAAAAAGASVASVSALIVAALGEAVAVYSIYDLWKERNQTELDRIKDDKQAVEVANKITDSIVQAEKEGRAKISAETQAYWDSLLNIPNFDREQLRAYLAAVRSQIPNLLATPAERAQKVNESDTAAKIAQDHARAEDALAVAKGRVVSVAEQELTIQDRYSVQIARINSLDQQGLLTTEQSREARTKADTERLNALAAIERKTTDLKRIEQFAEDQFSSGMAKALVEVASGTKKASDAFKEFASSFLQQIAEMILKTIILAQVQALVRGVSNAFGGGATGGVALEAVFPAAFGGQFPRMMAAGGISEVNGATFFPRFNVIAGEAGREVMTVMARPRLMQIGGIAAQVGDAGPNRLAITNASDLMARAGGGGGHLDVTIHLDQHLEGEIVGKATHASVQMVTSKMGQRGPLSETTRRLLNQ